MPRKWSGVIEGQCYSKSNGKRPGMRKGKPVIRKSKNACDYKEACRMQLAWKRPLPMLKGRLKVTAVVYYRGRASDLDIATFYDAMEGFVYANDRAIFEEHVIKRHDKRRPRIEVVVEEIGPDCEREADRLIEWIGRDVE